MITLLFERRSALALIAAAAFVFPVVSAMAEEDQGTDALEEQVRATESAFAQTMADRDHEAFVSFLDQETIFFGRGELRGREAVAAAWKPFFEGEKAPFSWRPETVAVLDSGRLGLSSGPIFDPEGQTIGTYNSIWRLQADSSWKIIFDKGCPPCGE